MPMLRLFSVALAVACAPAPDGPEPTDASDVSDDTMDPVVDESLGEIDGDCGALADALSAPDPAILHNRITLTVDSFADAPLSEPGRTLYDTPNLGGSSGNSETLAFEMLHRCEGAALIATEAQVVYEDDGGKKTDLVVGVSGRTLGVSVVRAYGYPPEDPWTDDEAATIIERKLSDILLSSENVVDESAWERQILSVIAYTSAHADTVGRVWAAADPAIRADTVLYVTTADGTDTFIFQE